MTELTGWENFYVIVGSSAGALIGLQFVVIALIADMPITPGVAQASRAFGTPSTVHFAAVLLLAAIVSMPWNGVAIVALLWGFMGLSGVVYTLIVARRMRTQSAYQPVFEDWLFHFLLPLAAYAMLALSPFVAFSDARLGLFFVGAGALFLLFIGIHNTWDSVTHLVFVRKQEHTKAERSR